MSAKLKFILIDADVGDEVDEWAFNTGQRVALRLIDDPACGFPAQRQGSDGPEA